MFDHRHYVPILRWKRAEWIALGKLHNEERVRITPLVEITPRSIAPRTRWPSTDEMLRKNAADIKENWGQSPLFVDLLHLDPAARASDGSHPLIVLADKTRRLGASLIPVTGLQRDPEYQSAVTSIAAEDHCGVCIRLFPSDIGGSTGAGLLRLASRLAVRPQDIDLVIDHQFLADGSDYRTTCSLLPDLARWRTLTVASGGFPKDLTGLSVGQHRLPRRDWQDWKRQIVAARSPLRRAAFADYTIQHAIYSEPPAHPNFSASIRYTAEDDWLIMRGEGVFNDSGPGFQQWPANAQLLCGRPEFCGARFSYGDHYIFSMSTQTQRTGSAETWLRAGINHHLVYVAQQIASLAGA